MSNQAAEKLLLSSFVRYPQTFFNFVNYLSEDDFMSLGHKYIFQALKSLYLEDASERVSKLKLISKAKSLGFDNFMAITKDGQTIDGILAENLPEEECITYFQVVKRETIKRKYIDVADDVKGYINNTTDSAVKIIDSVEQRLIDVSRELNTSDAAIIPIGEHAQETIMSFSENPGHLGWDLGFPVWQHKIGQIRNGSITFVVAPPKQGKSQFGLKNALTVAFKFRCPVLLVDTELKKKDQIVRLIGMLANVPYEILETGFWKLSPDELKARNIPESRWAEFAEYKKRMEDPVLWEKVSKMPISYLEASGLGVEEVLPKLRRWILTQAKPSKDAKFPQCLIVYDYIKLATLDELRGGKLAEWQLHGLNVAALHDFVNKWNVPMLLFGQTNREMNYSTDCVAGAKRIIDNVSSISLLKRKDEDEKAMDPNGNYFLMPLETRYGAGMHNGGHINISFNPGMGDFSEIGISTLDFKAEKLRRLNEWKNKRRRDHHDDDDDD
jgi:replicative DNA helicase